MRINVNLATQPFEDAQEFLRRWLRLLLPLFLVTLVLIWYTGYSYYRARDLNKKIGVVQSQIQQLQREAQDARAMVARPENRSIVQRSEFLNSVFARKAFSWTTVFSDMEKIMPYGLSVVSIRPQLAPNNELNVAIVVGGDSRDRAIELVRSMEKLPRFRDVTLVAESVPDAETRASTGEAGRVRYTISAVYQPRVPAGQTSVEQPKNTPESASNQAAEAGGQR